MNRRTFLRSLAAVCGATVVCPGELLKSPVEFRPNPAQRVYMIDHPAFHDTVKTQQNSIPYGIPYWCGVPIHYQENLSI